MLGREIMKVLFSGSGACGQKRETEGMPGIRPFDEKGPADQFRRSLLWWFAKLEFPCRWMSSER